jgi:hypothetical protein
MQDFYEHLHWFENVTVFNSSHGSSVSIITGLQGKQLVFDSWQDLRTFLLTTASRPALEQI